MVVNYLDYNFYLDFAGGEVMVCLTEFLIGIIIGMVMKIIQRRMETR